MNYVIIVAGGKGLRMGGDVPKQFLPIGGKPILMRTLEAFHMFDRFVRIVLVLPRSEQEYWNELCLKYRFSLKYCIANGGKSRFESVRNGLAMIPDDEKAIVGVHDGVRPFVSTSLLERIYAKAEECGAVVPVCPSVDSLRKLTDEGKSISVDRSQYVRVQTPQVFSLEVLKRAYLQPFSDLFTDDASVVEAMGQQVELCQGETENIKITTPFDLIVARAMVEAEK